MNFELSEIKENIELIIVEELRNKVIIKYCYKCDGEYIQDIKKNTL